MWISVILIVILFLKFLFFLLLLKCFTFAFRPLVGFLTDKAVHLNSSHLLKNLESFHGKHSLIDAFNYLFVAGMYSLAFVELFCNGLVGRMFAAPTSRDINCLNGRIPPFSAVVMILV